jgi:deoxyribose-phosphate aldolase
MQQPRVFGHGSGIGFALPRIATALYLRMFGCKSEDAFGEKGTNMNIAKYIDHTILKQDARRADVERICDEAREHGFATVCVNSCWTSLVAERLAGSGVGVTVVVGFPLGACSTQAKAFEAKQAVADGATEIDMVINVGWLKDGDDAAVTEDIRAVVEAARPAAVKVILECCLLDDEQIARACECSIAAGAAFVKTSTGFSTGGATIEDVELMRKTVGDRCKVKAAGGIHNRVEADAMIAAGADRLGCSAGIAIVNG